MTNKAMIHNRITARFAGRRRAGSQARRTRHSSTPAAGGREIGDPLGTHQGYQPG